MGIRAYSADVCPQFRAGTSEFATRTKTEVQLRPVWRASRRTSGSNYALDYGPKVKPRPQHQSDIVKESLAGESALSVGDLASPWRKIAERCKELVVAVRWDDITGTPVTIAAHSAPNCRWHVVVAPPGRARARWTECDHKQRKARVNVWQVATGEAGRDYRELFLDHDLMILGPSRDGDAREVSYARGKANSAERQVHSFALGPKPGDRVLMRFGREVIGVGEVPAGEEHQYAFDETFRSVYGWDLCHRRRVKWAPGLELGSLAGVYGRAKQKPSFTQVHEQAIVGAVAALDPAAFAGPLLPLPEVDTDIYIEEELGVALFQAGVSNTNIDAIQAALRQAERLCSWYGSKSAGRWPTEHEVISHIVLPLFLGLGWSHQQIAVEWNRVDVAFFKRTPTHAENCVMVLEAKGLGRGLGNVLEQPSNYCAGLGLAGARYIVVTDGANLFVYEREGDHWRSEPVGYVSIPSLQRQYVLPKGINLVDSLVRLQPSSM